MKGLKGRVALVTGATGLIGGAIARRLAAEQTTVAVASRDLLRAKRWMEENQSTGDRYFAVPLNLADRQSIRDCLDKVVHEAGVPTIIVASASRREDLSLPLEQLSHDAFASLFNVDIAGHVLLVQETVQRLAGPASIIFLSSIYGQSGVDHSIYPDGMVGTPVQYAAVKAAAHGAVRWLAARWGDRAVRVNALVSGGVASEQRQPEEFVRRYSAKTMLRRMASADEVANAAAFLASDESSYITGQYLVVDGGLTAW